MSLPQQVVEEIHLLKCSLLPGELLLFAEHASQWNHVLDSYYTLEPDCNLVVERRAVRFEVKLETSSDIWFDVELPPDYADGGHTPHVSVKGDSLGRADQEQWQSIVLNALHSVQGSEYPVYELMSTHLLPRLHASLDEPKAPDGSAPVENAAVAQLHSEVVARKSSQAQAYHALFVSHHLKSPQKRRSLSHWSHELSLTGFAKVGYPGIIYCEGAQEDVEDFVKRVKSMQWLGLRLRFVEPLPPSTAASDGDRPSRQWAEFEKVGEAVEEMKRLGREKFVVEMGIGSSTGSS